MNIRIKQTKAELRNKRRKVQALIQAGQTIPEELLVKIKDLRRRI